MTSDFALPSFFFSTIDNFKQFIDVDYDSASEAAAWKGVQLLLGRRASPSEERGARAGPRGRRSLQRLQVVLRGYGRALCQGRIGVACSLAIIYPRAFSGRGTVACVGWMLDLVAQPSHAPEVTESCTASGGPRLGSYNEPGALQGRRGGGPG